MPKTKGQKKQILDSLTEKINQSKSIVFTNFDGLKVSENEALRKKLKEEDSEYYVAKKTLINIAFQNSNLDDIDIKKLEGKVATVFSYVDEVASAKIIDNFKKELGEEKINFLGGILENKFLSKEEVEFLAKLPSKQELQAKLVGTMNAPISGFVNVLAGNMRSLVCVLKAIEEKK